MVRLTESEKFNSYDVNRLARQVRQNDGRANRGVIYQDDRRYNDYQGEKWLDVRSRDKITLISAILDGMSDAKFHYKGKLYDEIRTEEDLMASYEANRSTVDSILNFLRKYMRGHTTVYRGFSFSLDDYQEIKAKHGIKFEHQILKVLNNRGKKFNSFSVSPYISKDFSDGSNGDVSVVIAAEVEPNDIAFAFTAYLLGRHGDPSEFELNINNLKDLKNLRVIHDIDKECARVLKYSESEESLQKRLDAGEPLSSVFEYVTKIKLFDGVIYKCSTTCGNIIVKDNKIIIPRCKDIHFLRDGLYIVTPMGDPNESNILYNLNTGHKSKSYEAIFHMTVSSDDKLTIAYAGTNKYTLLNLETCQPVFNGYAKGITRLPGVTWYGQKNIWHSAEFYQVKLQNNLFTIFNDNGRCIFKRSPQVFKKIDCRSDKLKFDAELDQDIVKHYLIKDNMAVEEM
jgi:hypothetical protein